MPRRPARTGDAPAITRIFQTARDHAPAFGPKLHTDAEDHAFFARSVEQGGFTVAVKDERIVAFLALEADEIRHLYVAPADQRHGHGSALLTAAQASSEHLELWVFQRNANAVAFYAAHGFTIITGTDGAGNEEHEPDYRMAWSLQ